MSVVGRVGRSVLRGLAAQLAARAAQAELFERPGERQPQEPVFSASERAPRPAAAAPEPVSETRAAPSDAVSSRRVAAASLTNINGLQAALKACERLTVVNHWATWCIPCIEEFGHLKSLHARMEGRVDFLGVSWDLFDPRGDEDDIREHVENFGTGQALPWKSLVLDESVAAETFFQSFDLAFHQIPQTWVVKAGGAVVHRVDGVVAADDVDGLVALLEEHLAD